MSASLPCMSWKAAIGLVEGLISTPLNDDRLDGAVDGVLQDPRACHFDPSVLRCQAGDGPNCFTDDQIKVLKAITQVKRNKFGSVVARGWPFTGEERSWGTWFSGLNPPPLDANGKPDPTANQSFATLFGIGLARDFIFTEHPAGDYDWRTFDPDFDLGRLTEDAGLLSAMDPNLGPMASRGGKMLFVGRRRLTLPGRGRRRESPAFLLGSSMCE